MDLDMVTLNARFEPTTPIDEYKSLVWTERYSKYGDFEIVFNDIARGVNLLPLESCVTLRDSSVPMIVENYQLQKPKGDGPSVKITGRSYETVIERRASVNALATSGARTAWAISAARESDAAYLAMRIVIGDEPRYRGGSLLLPLTNPAVSPRDAIPEISLTLPADYIDVFNSTVWDSLTSYLAGAKVRYIGYLWRAKTDNLNVPPSSSVPATWEKLEEFGDFEIKLGNLYGTVIELINTSHRGLKAVRPLPGNDKVGIEIYNGANLTDLITFDARFDQIDDANYLLSNQGSTNIGYVYGPNGAQIVRKNTLSARNDIAAGNVLGHSLPPDEPSGLARRVLPVDLTGDDTATTTDVRKSRGLIELYKYNATALFDGQVAEQVAAGYNNTYFLGDIVKLVGEYALEQNVRVVEFIRTSDSNGTKNYPTFEAVDD